MPSKQVVDKSKSARKVGAAGTTHEQAIVTAVGKLFGAAAGAAAGVLVKSAVHRLTAAEHAMVEADQAHIAEQADDAPQRSARDEAAAKARKPLVELREVATTLFGGGVDNALGFRGPTPDDPASVHAQSGTTLKLLESWVPPAPRFEGMSFDKAHWVNRLREAHLELGKGLEHVAREEREAEATYVAKKRSMEDFDGTFSAAANIISLMLEVAGELELARRVRPSTRRPGVTADTDQESPSPED